MPPGEGGRGEQGCMEQSNSPADYHQGHDDDSPPHSPLPFSDTVMMKQEHAVSLPSSCTAQDHSPSTYTGGHDEDAPPLPSTETKQEQEQHPMGSLPADILVEILSQLPYRSLCRFKCVSKPWMALCSDPDIRKKSSQTLSGFFYKDGAQFSFRNLFGRGVPLVDPSLPFLRGSYDRFTVEHCCGGLLLCQCWKSQHEEDDYDYVVCNPMTGKRTVLPPILSQEEEDGDPVRFEPMEIFLGFDTAVSSHFMVFAPLTNCDNKFTEMSIYSSETGQWTTVESDPTTLPGNSQCVFLNGTMHLATRYGSVVTVDAEGDDWWEINMPEDIWNCSISDKVSIGQSQGRLHVWQMIDDDDEFDDGYLSVWVLKDYDSGKWTLKHTANTVSKLFGRRRGEDDISYTAFAMHPDCNCIFLTDEEDMVVLYDMDKRKVTSTCLFGEFKDVLPYTPCFAEWP